ncbi:cell division protein ZapA [Oceanobacillus salinisoli]|uniref:cell division protein ZapA n=1 Tax=Oceanobacillus salinisoli TaxID=2678611 RepID=UPI0012E282B4|nr:cell division protein ZapA [Oceanobacillus salinisoli]
MTQENKERVSVEIHNRTYTVVGDDESASHVRLVASLVDQKMKDIQSSNKHLDTASLAVLTALNTMNDYLKLKEEYARLLGSMNRKED